MSERGSVSLSHLSHLSPRIGWSIVQQPYLVASMAQVRSQDIDRSSDSGNSDNATHIYTDEKGLKRTMTEKEHKAELERIHTFERVGTHAQYYEKDGLRTEGDGMDHTPHKVCLCNNRV